MSRQSWGTGIHYELRGPCEERKGEHDEDSKTQVLAEETAFAGEEK